MLALCQEHRLEHRTKHIALRYFLARELQQRGQLRLAYVASQANTADVFTKALEPCDDQRFCTVLGLTLVSVDAYAELTFDDKEAQEREEEEYRQKVGSLQFAVTTTRPDIAFTCSKLGSGLTFGGGSESLELVGYVDADDAGDKQNWTSTGGYMFVFGEAAVSWSSQRIKCRTLSSTELEYVAATDAGKEGRRLRFLLAKFKLLDTRKPTTLHVDNKLAIMVVEGLGLTGNLKHMEQRYAWLQHMVRRRKFVLKYIPTTEQLANFLTKVLHFPAFNWCSVAIGQVRLADVGDSDDEVQQ
ncbi:unnamed protein product [Closterium sp. NIES-54]